MTWFWSKKPTVCGSKSDICKNMKSHVKNWLEKSTLKSGFKKLRKVALADYAQVDNRDEL